MADTEELEWPFLGSEVLAARRIPERAMRSLYVAVYRDVYVPYGIELTAAQRAHAAWLWSHRRAVVVGNSAAALLGAKWVDPLLPAELNHLNRRPPVGITVYTERLRPDELVEVDGIPVTNAARTAFDIGRRSRGRVVVQRLDALMSATNIGKGDIEAVIAEHRGARGLVRLRGVLPLVDGGAESPQETRTRLVLTDAGLPPPMTQVAVLDEFGCLIARIDMGWEEWRVGVEYDGAQHWTDPSQRARDIDRLAELAALGWVIIRVSAEMLRERPGVFIERVRAALSAAGWSPFLECA
jgi:Protein of unknown function (DUF559)